MKYLKKYLSISLLLFVISTGSVFAATGFSNTPTTAVPAASTQQPAPQWTPLVPNAFGTDTGAATSNLSAFLSAAFNWAIAAAVVLALVMIIWGGIEYMTTDSFTGKDAGKARITDALKGLGLALVSWLILYTINPTLVTFQGNTLLSGKALSGITAPTTAPAVSNNINTRAPTCPEGKTCVPAAVLPPATGSQTCGAGNRCPQAPAAAPTQ